MKSTLFGTVLVALGLFVTNPAWADTNYTVMAWKGSIRDHFYIKTSSGYEPLDIYSTRRSDTFRHIGEGPVYLYTKNENTEGEPVFLPAAQVEIPNTFKEPLLLIFEHSNETGLNYTILPVEDSPEVYASGCYRFVNWTDKVIAAKLGEAIFKLEPKHAKTIDSTKENDDGMQIQMVELEDDENRLLYSSRWTKQNHVRKLVLIVPRNEQGRAPIQIKIIADYPKPDSASPNS